MRSISTVRQLSEFTGIGIQTIHTRLKAYPLKCEKWKGEKGAYHYPEGELLLWHEKVSRILKSSEADLNSSILMGESARLNNQTLADNPFIYNSQIKQFCAWAAGWHDAK